MLSCHSYGLKPFLSFDLSAFQNVQFMDVFFFSCFAIVVHVEKDSYSREELVKHSIYLAELQRTFTLIKVIYTRLSSIMGTSD